MGHKSGYFIATSLSDLPVCSQLLHSFLQISTISISFSSFIGTLPVNNFSHLYSKRKMFNSERLRKTIHTDFIIFSVTLRSLITFHVPSLLCSMEHHIHCWRIWITGWLETWEITLVVFCLYFSLWTRISIIKYCLMYGKYGGTKWKTVDWRW